MHVICFAKKIQLSANHRYKSFLAGIQLTFFELTTTTPRWLCLAGFVKNAYVEKDRLCLCYGTDKIAGANGTECRKVVSLS
jgi:hypothetical protein